MPQFKFIPPTRDPSIDILQHIWATKYAISSWEAQTPKYIEIQVSEGVENLLKMHPKLQKERFPANAPNSVWGIPIRVDYSLSDDPGYAVIYTRED